MRASRWLRAGRLASAFSSHQAQIASVFSFGTHLSPVREQAGKNKLFEGCCAPYTCGFGPITTRRWAAARLKAQLLHWVDGYEPKFCCL